jgi:acetyl-CoA synthetase
MKHDALIDACIAGGFAPAAARTMLQSVDDCLSKGQANQAWEKVSRQWLTPTHPFELHRAMYERCHGENALLLSLGPAWFPDQATIARSNIASALRELRLPDYPAFYRWSIENRPDYWKLLIDRLNVCFQKSYDRVLDAMDPIHPRWLEGARFNIADTCLGGDANAPAVLQSDRDGRIQTTTYGQLRSLVGRVANGLVAGGIRPGDVVAMVMPVTAASVASYLAVIAAGAAVVSIPDSFASSEIAMRLRISEAKLIFTQDGIDWGAKRIDLYDKVKTAAMDVPIIMYSAESSVAGLRPQDHRWTDFLSADERVTSMPRDPHDPINILFSSGTTSEPKAIPWDHTTPIKCAADGHFHHDLHPGDVTCWPTNLGWMMGPWLIFASLMNRAAIALHTQAPHDAGFGRLVRDAKVTMLGCVPSLVRAWKKTDCMRGLDWSGIRAFSSSGECSNAVDSLYLMHLAGYRPVIEYCGGTEIGGAYATSTVVQPNIPAAFSTPALGLEMALLDEHGKPARSGEAFLIGPSIGLSTRLLNKDHDSIYFSDAPRTATGALMRRHGDELEQLPNGYYRVAGRCDDTMNLGGIKVGCAEIERALIGVAGVFETAAIAIAPPGGGPSQLVIFVVPDPGGAIPPVPELKAAMQQQIRQRLNPLFSIHAVEVTTQLPRTASNKVMRRELRALLAPKMP